MTEIRDATEADLGAILEITNEAIANTTAVWSLTPATMESRRSWMVERQSRGFPVRVATLDGAVIGFASFGDFRPWEGYAHTVEHSLYVHPAAQGHGAGKDLLGDLITLAQAKRKHVMMAGIESGNIVSLALHRRLGFEETGRLPEVGRKFDRWLDLVLMQKILA
jgi:phosphinothricin acetyltransferase